MHKNLHRVSGLLEFATVARLGSIKLAALELHKTPAAVSLQMKTLEHKLGFELLERHARGIKISTKGRELAGLLQTQLEQLSAKIAALQSKDAEHVLRITSTHSFAMKWLAPRLGNFTLAHPKLDCHLSSSDALESDCDIAIRYSAYQAGETYLYREHLVAVYSPKLLTRGKSTLETLAQIARYPLLYEGDQSAWNRLFKSAKIKHPLHFAQNFSHAGTLVQAALAAQGVALAPFSIASHDLAQGNLLRVAKFNLAHDYGYQLIVSDTRLEKNQQFFAWMQDEIEKMKQSIG
ncbi:LysR substrate-binding domain-containing protein [Undibacterium sp. Ren11W]|uniref:LysR substrate-binding domain-containing protein n=1 Tax=Undibacterium sp. Ren11W TaxID=3413045 RepID=UPI003BEF9AB3